MSFSEIQIIRSESELKKICWFMSSRKLLINVYNTFFMPFNKHKDYMPFDEIIVHIIVILWDNTTKKKILINIKSILYS
jgi:hypothetical protein